MSGTRERLRAYVESHPGVHVSGLVRGLDLAPGQVQYHLKRLRERDAVVGDELYGRTHYFPPHFDADERRTLALARRETSREVLFYLLEHGATPATAVADDLDLARSTLTYHRDRLTEAGVVTERRDERGRVVLALADPETTLSLLRSIRPSLPARLVDRFTRLVDDLLEG